MEVKVVLPNGSDDLQAVLNNATADSVGSGNVSDNTGTGIVMGSVVLDGTLDKVRTKSVRTKTAAKRVLTILAAVLLIVAMACPTAMSAEAKNITKGDTVTNIKAVQTRLKTLGYYNSSVDGIWGSRTLAAVKNFQKAKGLTADGVVGPRTEKALGITLNSSGSGGGGSASSADLNLLARCVYGEARGEPYTGQVAVAAVVLNRIKSSSFPNTVSGVIYQKYAFTCVADGQINLSPNQSAYNAARDALNGVDPTNGCLFYYNPATATSKWIWSLTVEIKIGRHSFARA